MLPASQDRHQAGRRRSLGSSLGFIVRTLLWLGVAASAAVVLLGLGQQLHPALDSFSHFRVHGLVSACIGLMLLGIGARRYRRTLLLVAGIPALWALSIQWHRLPQESRESDFRVAQFNLKVGNQRTDLYLDGLRALDADVLLLQEITHQNASDLAALDDIYPFQSICLNSYSQHGVGILSKTLMEGGECRPAQRFTWRELPDYDINVASIHAVWPWPDRQHQHVRAWGPQLRAARGLDNTAEPSLSRLILGGDFNAAPWSETMRQIQIMGQLERLPGALMTINVMGVPLPIDHQLHSPGICPQARRQGPSSLGSDHTPVIVEYLLQAC